MPYTSWGWMTHDDIRDVEEDMDLGSILVSLDDAPEWFVNSHHEQARCPLDDRPIWNHESVTVMRASGGIVACVDPDGETHQLPADDEGVMYA